MPNESEPDREQLSSERWEALAELEAWLEWPMVVLGAAWLVLLVVDLARGLGPVLEGLATFIWIVFIFDFVIKLVLAPEKMAYLRRNWLSALALLAPALRVLRAARAVRVLRLARGARGVRLVSVVGSVNRGMRALGATFRRRGFGYVTALTVIVTFVGAAGMLAFERNTGDPAGLNTYSAALWWTAMIMTTMGSEYWPRSAEGRILCVLLALYGFAMFGYVTATLATFFIGRDAENSDAEVAGQKSIGELRAEIAALREEIRALAGRR